MCSGRPLSIREDEQGSVQTEPPVSPGTDGSDAGRVGERRESEQCEPTAVSGGLTTVDGGRLVGTGREHGPNTRGSHDVARRH